MNMKQLFGLNGPREEAHSQPRRFNRQSSIPRFVVFGDMIRPVPMEGVVPHRRVGERPAGPLFEARVTQKPQVPVGKRPVSPEAAGAVASNPFSAAPVKTAHNGVVGRIGFFVASMFKRRAPVSPAPTSTVQAELRLDAVKPLRNELSDSDSEVVELQPVPLVVSGAGVVAEDIPAPARIIQPSPASSRLITPMPGLIGKP